MKSLSLELQFSSQRLKNYLQKNPHEAQELAVNYFEDFIVLAIEHKQLQADFEAMQQQLIQLQSSTNPPNSPQLPFFLSQF